MNQISYSNKIVALLIRSLLQQGSPVVRLSMCIHICGWSDLEHRTEPWLLLRRHSCWPCPLTPLSLWICKEFLITLYIWSALNSCVKLCTLKTHHALVSSLQSALHIKPRAGAAQVYQGNTSVEHVVFIFSFLWVPKFDLSSVLQGPENPRLHSHLGCLFSWMLKAFNTNI